MYCGLTLSTGYYQIDISTQPPQFDTSMYPLGSCRFENNDLCFTINFSLVQGLNSLPKYWHSKVVFIRYFDIHSPFPLLFFGEFHSFRYLLGDITSFPICNHLFHWRWRLQTQHPWVNFLLSPITISVCCTLIISVCYIFFAISVDHVPSLTMSVNHVPLWPCPLTMSSIFPKKTFPFSVPFFLLQTTVSWLNIQATVCMWNYCFNL